MVNYDIIKFRMSLTLHKNFFLDFLSIKLIVKQVAKSDFLKLNEFAEGAMIARNISQAADIRHQRKALLLR